jgi:nitrogen fixation/metabolism regulation signal transduction histidine kinase
VASLPRVGRFETQVRVTLALLAVFLAAANLANLWLLLRARDALASAERESAAARAREAMVFLGPARLARGDPAPDESALRRAAARLDLSTLSVLDPNGSVRAASGSGSSNALRPRQFPQEVRDALAAGRTVTRDGSETVPPLGDHAIVALVPLLDAGGGLLAIVEAVHAAPALAALEESVRVLVVVQVGGVGLLAMLALLFARWVSLPYRRLAEAAEEAGLGPPGGEGAAGPADLAEAFRAVTAKLREQERAIGSVEREGGSLGDLVRFARGPGHGMGTGVLVVDGKGRVVASNPAAERLLPSASAAGSGAPLHAVAASVQGLEPLVLRCLETGRGASREVLDVRRGAESVGHLGVAVSPASGYAGEVAGALVLMTDLTEIRRVQQQVRLRDNLSAVGQVAAGIAHEVRNALGTILGYARLLEKRPEAPVRGPAREILKEVQAVRAALDDFLAYARPPEPHPGPVPLGDVVRACAAAAPANLRVEVEGEFATVVADETLLRRAFGNLVQNASDAAVSAGRSLLVRIVGSRVGETSLLVDVEDDGPGIPEGFAESVFLPFVTGRPSGTGLGLALVQRTMLDLGGSVEARRGRNGGALFRLRFPVAPAERHVS